tara:strand:+ start:463 stop:681 length:219 start_codon:yes stop_codon:yes gene_type:complete
LASISIKEIKANCDYYELTGLLKSWSQFKYRKLGETKWLRMRCCSVKDDLIKKIGILMVMGVGVIVGGLQSY